MLQRTASLWESGSGLLQETAATATKGKYHYFFFFRFSFFRFPGQPYTTFLKLTGCLDGEFTCNDGECIQMEQRQLILVKLFVVVFLH